MAEFGPEVRRIIKLRSIVEMGAGILGLVLHGLDTLALFARGVQGIIELLGAAETGVGII